MLGWPAIPVDTRTEDPTASPARADTVPVSSSTDAPPGTIGRYVVTGTLGKGISISGMMVIFLFFAYFTTSEISFCV